MPFLIYNIPFENFENQELTIQIQNLDTYEGPGGDTGGGTLQGSENVCILESIDNDSDKTKAIKSRRLRFGFNSTAEFDASTFSDGSDTTFFTALKRGFADSFHGFISLDDISEAFQPKPNPVQMIASDGLGFLKNVELKTVADELPLGKYTIMEYIVMCLTGTGLDMTINVVMNLFEEDTDPLTEHSWNLVFLDALTFEKDIDEREDRYTVLNKILDAFGCFITQDYEGWWIVRWDEYDAITADRTTLRVARFGADGSFIQYEDVVMDKIIVADYEPEYEGHYLSQDTAVRRFQRKAKRTDIIYKYDLPHELICNIDFTRGILVNDFDPTPLKVFEIDCWELRRGFGATLTTPNCAANIWRTYDANGYEDERYAAISMPSSDAAPQNYIRSEGVPIEEKDKFDFGFDYSAQTDNGVDGPATLHLCAIILEGDDGSYWVLDDDQPSAEPNPVWKLTNVDFSTNADYIDWFFSATSGAEDYTEWQSASVSAPPAPVTGKVYIHLFAANQLASSIDNFIMRYNNLSFSYYAFIDGTYKKYAGHKYSVSRDVDARVIEKQIYLDSVKPLFKGTMFKEQSSPSAWIRTENWDDYVTPTAVGANRLGKHLVFAWWNQFRTTRTVIESDIQGIRTDLQGGVPAMQYRYEIHHGDESDKYFMKVSYSMDFRTCGWAGVFIENSSGDGDRIYTDTFAFKYITE